MIQYEMIIIFIGCISIVIKIIIITICISWYKSYTIFFEDCIYSSVSDSCVEYDQIYKFIQIFKYHFSKKINCQLIKNLCDYENNLTYLFHSTLVCLKYSQYQRINHDNGTNIYL